MRPITSAPSDRDGGRAARGSRMGGGKALEGLLSTVVVDELGRWAGPTSTTAVCGRTRLPGVNGGHGFKATLVTHYSLGGGRQEVCNVVQ